MNHKKKTTIIAWQYRRLMLPRYLIPMLFFINLYWLIIEASQQHILLIVPAFQLVLMIICIVEQYLFANQKVKVLKYHYYILFISGVLGLLSFVSSSIQLYLVFGIHLVVVIFALILKLLLVKRVVEINNNQDKFYLQYNNQLKKLMKGR